MQIPALLAWGIIATSPAIASAAVIVINNGLAPPQPANIVTTAQDLTQDQLVVANVGCDSGFECPSPGDPTAVSILGGTIGFGVTVRGTSSLVMEGGSIPFVAPDLVTAPSLGILEAATALVSGGDIGWLVASDAGSADVTGGTIRLVESIGAARIEIRGGMITENVQVYAGGTVRIFGTGFAVNGTAVPFGPVAADFGRLTGTLLSGEALDATFTRRAFGGPGDGYLLLVPEPSTLTLLAFSVIGLAMWTRTRSL